MHDFALNDTADVDPRTEVPMKADEPRVAVLIPCFNEEVAIHFTGSNRNVFGIRTYD